MASIASITVTHQLDESQLHRLERAAAVLGVARVEQAAQADEPEITPTAPIELMMRELASRLPSAATVNDLAAGAADILEEMAGSDDIGCILSGWIPRLRTIASTAQLAAPPTGPTSESTGPARCPWSEILEQMAERIEAEMADDDDDHYPAAVCDAMQAVLDQRAADITTWLDMPSHWTGRGTPRYDRPLYAGLARAYASVLRSHAVLGGETLGVSPRRPVSGDAADGSRDDLEPVHG